MLNLYKKFARLMYTTAFRYVPDRQNCEDVVQDAVESLCRKVHTLQKLPSPALPAYIVYTVKNRALNFIKHQTVVNKHTTELSPENLAEYESPDPSPESMVVFKDQMSRLNEVWPELPEQDQELLYRKYVLGQSDEILAGVFSLQKDSLRMRLTRARRKAMSLMERSSEHNGSNKA